MTKTNYETLGIKVNATSQDIKLAYRKLAVEFHPDKSTGNEEKFKEINEAYRILADPSKKYEYDLTLQEAREHLNYSTMFSSSFKSNREILPMKGEDSEILINIAVSEAFSGCSKSIEVEYFDNCSTCNGDGGDVSSKEKVCTECRGVGKTKIRKKTDKSTYLSLEVCPVCKGRKKLRVNSCKSCSGVGSIGRKESISICIDPDTKNMSKLTLSGFGKLSINGGDRGDLIITIRIY